MIRSAAASLLVLWAGAAGAVELSLPQGSRLVSDRGSAYDSYQLPFAAFENGAVRTRTVEGRVDRQSWRVESAVITTLQMLDPLRQQLDAAGFQTVFECEAQVCGGFDFRFGIEVIPAPDMYVDIRDYRFLAAEKDGQAISLIVSRSRTAGYVQIIQVSPAERPSLEIAADPSTEPPVDEEQSELAEQLVASGHFVLSDLTFQTGTAQLSEASYASLRTLAAFMQDNPAATVVLVGHTDATGDLEPNIELSKRRAGAVRQRLIETFDIAAERVRAEGMGYLSPRASNLTDEGRTQNRRVEVILLSLE